MKDSCMHDAWHDAVNIVVQSISWFVIQLVCGTGYSPWEKKTRRKRSVWAPWYSVELQLNAYHGGQFMKNVLIFEKKGGCWSKLEVMGNSLSRTVHGTLSFRKKKGGSWSKLELVPYSTTKFSTSSTRVLHAPRKVLRIPNTDLAPLALCEFCKSMQTHGNGPQVPWKRVQLYIEIPRSAGVVWGAPQGNV